MIAYTNGKFEAVREDGTLEIWGSGICEYRLATLTEASGEAGEAEANAVLFAMSPELAQHLRCICAAVSDPITGMHITESYERARFGLIDYRHIEGARKLLAKLEQPG